MPPDDDQVERLFQALLKHPHLAMKVRERLMRVQFVSAWLPHDNTRTMWYRNRHLSDALWNHHQGFAEEVETAAIIHKVNAYEGEGEWQTTVYAHHSDEPVYDARHHTMEEAKFQVDAILRNPDQFPGLPQTYFIDGE